jgi:hypothetical protein
MDRWPQTGVGLKQPWCWVAKMVVLNKTNKSHTKHKCKDHCKGMQKIHEAGPVRSGPDWADGRTDSSRCKRTCAHLHTSSFDHLPHQSAPSQLYVSSPVPVSSPVRSNSRTDRQLHGFNRLLSA